MEKAFKAFVHNIPGLRNVNANIIQDLIENLCIAVDLTTRSVCIRYYMNLNPNQSVY